MSAIADTAFEAGLYKILLANMKSLKVTRQSLADYWSIGLLSDLIYSQ